MPKGADPKTRTRHIPKAFRYIEDWALHNNDLDPIITQVPIETIEDYQRPDADIAKFAQILEDI